MGKMNRIRRKSQRNKSAYLVAMTWSGAEYYDGNERLEYDEPYSDWVYRVGPWVLNFRKNMPVIAINEETGERKNLTDTLFGGQVFDSLYYLNQTPLMAPETDSWSMKTMISEAGRTARRVRIASMELVYKIQNQMNGAFEELYVFFNDGVQKWGWQVQSNGTPIFGSDAEFSTKEDAIANFESEVMGGDVYKKARRKYARLSSLWWPTDRIDVYKMEENLWKEVIEKIHIL